MSTIIRNENKVFINLLKITWTITYYFLIKINCAFPNKLVRSMALFYISANFFNIWLHKRELDSHYLPLHLNCCNITCHCAARKFHSTSMRES